MASLIRQRDSYYLQFYDRFRTPKRKQVPLRTKTKRVAQRIARKLEDDYALGAFDPWRDDPHTYRRKGEAPKTLLEALSLFLERKRLEDKSENTINSYRWLVGGLVNRVGEDLLMDSLMAEQIDSYVKDGAVSKSTRHARFRHVRAFVRWSAQEGLLKHNPLERVDAPGKPQKLPKAMSEEELRAICEALGAAYRERRKRNHCREGEILWQIPLFRFAFYTGMRMSELARLRWGHIDHEKRLVYIYKQKNKKEQTIPLNAKAAEVLASVDLGEAEEYVFRSPRQNGRSRSTRRFVEHAARTFKAARIRAGIERSMSSELCK